MSCRGCSSRFWCWRRPWECCGWGGVSLDGTKVQGNASKHKAMSWGHVTKLERQLEGEVQTLLGLAERADQEEQGEQEQQELDIPEELERREERLAAIREAKEKIKERAPRAGRGGASGVRSEAEAEAGTGRSERQEGGRATAE